MRKMSKWPDQRGSTVLSVADCRRLLEEVSGKVGHLGFLIEGTPAVLPFNYVLLDDDVLLRVGPGSTLDALLSEPMVAFEIDHADLPDSDVPEAWSVLVQGEAHVVRDHLILQRARASGLTPLVEESGEVYVLVRSDVLSGRHFQVGSLARVGWQGRTHDPNSLVGALKLRPVVRVSATSSLAEVEVRLEQEGASVAVVNEAPLTVLSYRDLARALAAGLGPEASAGALAAAPLVTISPSAPLGRALELMARRDLDDLVVITDDGHAYGVLSAVEVARAITA